MPLINFIGIGGQRCGTTWIYEILKETHYFSYNYHFGHIWYQDRFDSSNMRTLGEYSTSYLYDIQCPERVFNYNKKMKIILSVRNPIERFISHHKHEVIGQRISKEILNPKKLIKLNPSYIDYGMYYKYLSHWLQYFPKDQILIVLFDDIKNNPNKVVEKIYQFLEVDISFVPESLYKKINSSWVAKSNLLLKSQRYIARILRKFGLGLMIDVIKKLGFKKTLDNINNDSNSDIIYMNEQDNKSFINYFYNDLKKLSDLIELDLSRIWSI